MKQAFIDLISSKKGLVYVTNALVMIGNMISGLFGYEVDPIKLGGFVALSSAWLIGQGIQDHGESAAKVNAESVKAMDAATTRTPQAGFANVGLLLVIVSLGCLALGCGWFTSEMKAVVADVVDCTKAEAAKAITEFGPVVDALLVYATGGNGAVNTDAIKDAAKNFGKDVGGCVLADAVARALKPAPVGSGAPKSSPLRSDPDSLRRVLAATDPGVHFHTANGDM